MISDYGKLHTKRFLAEMEPTLGRAIAFGIGARPENAVDASLQFEAGRVPIEITSYDFVNDFIVFKAELPVDFAGTIYELALYSRLENPSSGAYASRLLATFSSSEGWTNAVYTTTSTRLSVESLTHSPAAGQVAISSMGEIIMDLSGFSGQDRFSAAFNVSAAVENIEFTFLSDSANYFTFNTGALPAEYYIREMTKNSAIATGEPDWGNITEIQVATTSPAGTAAVVEYDGLRVEDADTITTDYVMVSRRVLAVPYTQTAGTAQEIEFALDINIS